MNLTKLAIDHYAGTVVYCSTKANVSWCALSFLLMAMPFIAVACLPLYLCGLVMKLSDGDRIRGGSL